MNSSNWKTCIASLNEFNADECQRSVAVDVCARYARGKGVILNLPVGGGKTRVAALIGLARAKMYAERPTEFFRTPITSLLEVFATASSALVLTLLPECRL